MRGMRTISEWVDFARSVPGDLLIVTDEERRVYFSLLNSAGDLAYDEYLNSGNRILCGSKHLVTPEELKEMISPSGHEHGTIKVRMVATFHQDRDGNLEFGFCSRLYSGEWDSLDKNIFGLLKDYPDGTKITIERDTFTEKSFYYVWDEEFNI